MVAASLCKRFVVAAAVLPLAAVPQLTWAHAGGHAGGHGGHAGAAAGAHVSGPAGRVVAGATPHVHGGGFRPHGLAPGFHHGHWVHGMHGGQLGGWWVAGATAPVYVQQVAPAAVLVQPQARYWCNVLLAYYPEVLTCPEPWMLVAPAPSPQ